MRIRFPYGRIMGLRRAGASIVSMRKSTDHMMIVVH